MIKIISAIPSLVCALSDKLSGYGVQKDITANCSSYYFKADINLMNKIDYLSMIQDLLRPFDFPEILFVNLDNDIDIEISLGADNMKLLAVQIFSHSAGNINQVHQHVSDAGFGLCRSGIRTFSYPEVIHGMNKKNLFIPHYLAWLAGMPIETVFKHDVEQVGETTALCITDKQHLDQFKRRHKPITIRCSDKNRGNHLRNYLVNLGYNICNIFIINSFPDPVKFSINIGCFNHNEQRNPRFEWLIDDIIKNMSTWMTEHSIDVNTYPFEERESDENLNDYNSIILDAPYKDYTRETLNKP